MRSNYPIEKFKSVPAFPASSDERASICLRLGLDPSQDEVRVEGVDLDEAFRIVHGEPCVDSEFSGEFYLVYGGHTTTGYGHLVALGSNCVCPSPEDRLNDIEVM